MIDIKEFVRIWRGSDSLFNVSEWFRISKETASKKAYGLRSKGVKLKKFKQPGRQPIDVAELNKGI